MAEPFSQTVQWAQISTILQVIHHGEHRLIFWYTQELYSCKTSYILAIMPSSEVNPSEHKSTKTNQLYWTLYAQAQRGETFRRRLKTALLNAEGLKAPDKDCAALLNSTWKTNHAEDGSKMSMLWRNYSFLQFRNLRRYCSSKFNSKKMEWYHVQNWMNLGSMMHLFTGQSLTQL